jgi:tRNA 2-thiouridine synthesizing protein E
MEEQTLSETYNQEGFPHAPQGWSQQSAAKVAAGEGISVGADHWEVVRALQEFFARHEDVPGIQVRELHDALDEHFHARGGIKFLYKLLPGGPVSQGCRLAGLEPPAGSADPGFGSVQ